MIKIKRLEPFIVTSCEVQKGNIISTEDICVTKKIAKGTQRFGFIPSTLNQDDYSLEPIDVQVDGRTKINLIKHCTDGIIAKLTGKYKIFGNDVSK